jgi:hypothetical protein
VVAPREQHNTARTEPKGSDQCPLGLSLQEAANALGVKKQTFRKRLVGAQRKADHLTGTYAGWADRLRREVAELGLMVDGLDPDRMADYVIPLTDRQRLWERVADRQWA